MTAVFLNGKLLSTDDATVSAFDAAVQHGVGLFETMLARLEDGHAKVFRLEEHLERLIDSARELGLSDSLRAAALADGVNATVETAGFDQVRVRLTITGGDLNLLGRAGASRGGGGGGSSGGGAGPIDPTILIVAQPATHYPEEMFERGVMVTLADLKVNPLDPFAGHKTINYWGRLRELQHAAARKAGEALVFQVTNHLAGGCVSNAFLVKDGELVTPIARGEEDSKSGGGEGVAMPSPVLPGIARGWVLEWAVRRRIKVTRRMIPIDDVLAADEVFLTNSSWGVLPVVRVEKHEVGDGEVGELTREAIGAWEAEA